MTTTPDNRRALSSDGELNPEGVLIWQQSGTTRDCERPTTPDPNVVKLVLGKRDEQSEAKPWQQVLDILTSDLGLKHHFPNLTHLHLWGLPMEKLGPLPDGLKVLDLRGCRNLEEFEELPRRLETLDVAGCTSLKALSPSVLGQLRFLYLDDCLGLEGHAITGLVKEATKLEELSASGCVQLREIVLPKQPDTEPDEKDGFRHPQFPPFRLKKTSLDGCTGLVDLPDMNRYRWLHHLSLNGCTRLERIESLPVGETEDGRYLLGIRHLYLADCPAFREFRGCDVREVYRSTDAKDNVADFFRVIQGSKAAEEIRMAKVLFLGSGRCGKTTLCAALRWYSMIEEEKLANPDLNPSKKRGSTRDIKFYPWKTGFGSEGGQQGIVHLWDFGGQEVYHGTHRIFASQGSVFVIATSSPAVWESRLNDELKGKGVAAEGLLREQNEYREIKYWLDYIRSALDIRKIDDLGSVSAKARVIIVHTGPGELSHVLDYLKGQAGPYWDLIEKGQIVVEYIDFGNSSGGQGKPRGMKVLDSWVRTQIESAADQFGTRVPALFARVADRCSRMMNDPASKRMGWKHWEEMVLETGEKSGIKMSRLEWACAARMCAKLLHRCGHVFLLDAKAGGTEVILNQEWCIKQIYSITQPVGMEKTWEISGSLMNESAMLEAFSMDSPDGFALLDRKSGMQRTVLDFLDQCGICVNLGGSGWMAVQGELLPDNDLPLQQELFEFWEREAFAGGSGMTNHNFALRGNQNGLLGNSDYRSVLIAFGRGAADSLPRMLFGVGEDREREWESRQEHEFESEPRFWKDGFQWVLRHRNRKTGEIERLVLRCEWNPKRNGEKRHYDGGLFFQFLCPSAEIHGARLMTFLFEENGPLSIFKGVVKPEDCGPVNLADGERYQLRGAGQLGWTVEDSPPGQKVRHHVALSYRGSEQKLALEIAGALRLQGYTVYIYQEDELKKRDEGQEDGQRSQMIQIYDFLKYAHVLLVIASKDYFGEVVNTNNRYCPLELMEAVSAWMGYSEAETKLWDIGTSNRPSTNLIWVSGDKSLNRYVSAGETLDDSLRKVIKEWKNVYEHTRVNETITALEARRHHALRQPILANLGAFCDEFGANAGNSRVDVVDRSGQVNLDGLLARITKCLKP